MTCIHVLPWAGILILRVEFVRVLQFKMMVDISGQIVRDQFQGGSRVVPEHFLEGSGTIPEFLE